MSLIVKDLHREFEETVYPVPSKEFFKILKAHFGLSFQYEDYSNPTINFTSYWYSTYYKPWLNDIKNGNTKIL